MIKAPDDGSYLVELDLGVLRISFNRPEYGNAVPATAVPQLIALFEEAKKDPSVRAVLMRGEGKMFSAGGDVAAFKRSVAQNREERQADFAGRLPRLRKLVETVVAFDKPLVVAIRGACAGAGLLYPLAADIVVGESDATFVFAHQRIGLSPDGGVTALLPLVVGTRVARRLVLTAAKVEGEEAVQLGLLDEIVETGALEAASLKIARRLARAPQTAIRTAKRLLALQASGASLAEMLDGETAGIVASVGDDDFAEGVSAFMEKRAASFPSARGS